MIRRANVGDCAAIAELTRELGYEVTPEESAARLEVLGVRDDAIVLVALVGDRPAGWIHGAHVLSMETPEFAEIRGLVVSEAVRGAGVGAKLVAAVEQWSRERGLRRIRVRSNIRREATRKFYERLGFAVVKTQNVFDKSL